MDLVAQPQKDYSPEHHVRLAPPLPVHDPLRPPCSRYLRNVSVENDMGKPNVEFTADGVLKAAELKIMNLRPGNSKQMLAWEEVR